MKKTVAVAVGTAFVGLSLTSLAQASGNPFGATLLDRGYQVAEGEGKCGEGKCGEKKGAEGSCGEGKCGAEMFKKMDKDGDGKLTMDEFMAGHKGAEGKCGEGKCGGDKKAQ